MTFLTRNPVFRTKFAFWGDMGHIQQNFGGNLVFAGGSGPRDWRSHHHTYNFFWRGSDEGCYFGGQVGPQDSEGNGILLSRLPIISEQTLWQWPIGWPTARRGRGT